MLDSMKYLKKICNYSVHVHIMSQYSSTFWLPCVANCTRVGDSKQLFQFKLSLENMRYVLCTHEKTETESPNKIQVVPPNPPWKNRFISSGMFAVIRIMEKA